MSNSFIFIIEIQAVRWIFRLPQGILKCNLCRDVIWKAKKMIKPVKFPPCYYLRLRDLPCDGTDSVICGDIRPFDIENRNSQQPPLEQVYRVFECFRQCPSLTIVQKYTAHIIAKGADIYLNVHRVHDIHCKYFSSLFSIEQCSQQLTFPPCFFSVSPIGEFFCFFSSFITRSHGLNFDGCVFFAYSIFLISDEIWLILLAHSMLRLISSLMYAYRWSLVMCAGGFIMVLQ